MPRRTAGRRGQAPELLAGAADLLGAGSAAVVEDEGHPMLCLSQPVVLPAPVVEWPLDQLHRQPESARALFEALALAAPHGPHTTRFLIGLWTAEYGYLHTGELTLDLLSHAYDCSGAAQIELTGIHQRLHGETRSGPWAHSNYFQFTPAATPTQPWPLSPGPRAGSHRPPGTQRPAGVRLGAPRSWNQLGGWRAVNAAVIAHAQPGRERGIVRPCLVRERSAMALSSTRPPRVHS
ncbi:hypothetical protein OG298_43775 (plasmid) [Streptomyces sp. NBC_01005]|uniref:hypothetical protein n=1 Tax=unclassified Streptomyces TaxID=2593676 RepID=UPI002E3386D3|nr:hypothetical protein [Streptomyces sp. NBC_01362]WSW11177.1 hypothetical protein OG298_43775 [Streptomyces sp. NBC_01005]WTD00685.1 hypothetical protein OH736_43780 [Streptomyces sp. NBC_01650]